MAKSLTSKQEIFVKKLLLGLNQTEAARQAGYSHPTVAAHGLMRTQSVRKALLTRRTAAFEGELATAAMRNLKEIVNGIEDKDTGEIRHIADPKLRFSVSKYILERAGHGKAESDENPNENKDLGDMTPAELLEVMNSGRQALGELASMLEGKHIIDGEARQLREVQPADSDADDDLSFLE